MEQKSKREFHQHEIVWTREGARRIWDYYGSSDAHKATYFGETVADHFVRVLTRKGVLRGAKTIVDFSCGTGAIIEAILRRVPRESSVTGYDPSIQSVNKANARNAGAAGFSGAYQIDEYPTDLPGNSVDALILTEVIEHLDDESLHSVLTECHRVLAQDGTIVLTTPNEEELESSKVLCPECGCVFHRWQHVRKFTSGSVVDLLHRYNFSTAKATTVTWGNEFIDLAFFLMRRKKTGLLIVAKK